MCDRVGDRMAQRRAEDASAILSPHCVHKEWKGDDLSVRGEHVGLRAAAANLAKKLFGSEEHRDEVVDLMNSQQIDIMVASEPGNACGMTVAALRNYMIKKDMEVVIMTRGSYGMAGGQVMIINRQWAKLQRTVHQFYPVKADRDRAFAVEFNNKLPGAHNKMLVVGYYGYNDAPDHRDEIKEMHDFLRGIIKSYRTKNPFGSLMLMGDLNAAQWSEIDTDREHDSGYEVDSGTQDDHGWEPEADSFVVTELTGLGLTDAIRDRYPCHNFVTRRVDHQTKRFLDRIFVSKELANAKMRAGIYQQGIFTYGGVDTDHMVVVIDLSIDCAGGAAKRVKLWTKHKKPTLRWA
jgi:exonuclease III